MSEENITRLHINGKEIIIVGTAHVSKRSSEQVKEVIELEKPDSVCIELDEQRYQTIKQGSTWKDMDIFKVIKEKKATLLLINLALSSFQKRMANQFGINAGQEMIQAIESANAIDANIVLADRNIQTTFSRIWNAVGILGKVKLLFLLIFSVFSNDSITEEELEEMKSQDMLNSVLSEVTMNFPRLKRPLIDERDQYLSQKIKSAPGDKIIAILGAAHVPGVKEEIKKDHDLNNLSLVPSKPKTSKMIGWLIPLFIVAIIAYTFYKNPSAGYHQTLSWILWNGTFSALGTLVAFGHPLAILTAFIAAPITSLNPLLAAGWFAGAVQALVKRPNVSDFDSISTDVYSFKGFWSNKVIRVLLIVVLANIGSAIGTVIGGSDIIRIFLNYIGS